jgi:toxin HigB-1
LTVAVTLRLVGGLLVLENPTRQPSLPGLGLHPLKGDRKGTWAVKVSGNWRVTFTFVEKDADQVDYEDYH